jgi:hypothetical protein
MAVWFASDPSFELFMQPLNMLQRLAVAHRRVVSIVS